MKRYNSDEDYFKTKKTNELLKDSRNEGTYGL